MKKVNVEIEVDDHFNWLVRDSDGFVWVTNKKPKWSEDMQEYIPDSPCSKIIYSPEIPRTKIKAQLTQI